MYSKVEPMMEVAALMCHHLEVSSLGRRPIKTTAFWKRSIACSMPQARASVFYADVLDLDRHLSDRRQARLPCNQSHASQKTQQNLIFH